MSETDNLDQPEAKAQQVADHRTAPVTWSRGDENLDYPFDDVPDAENTFKLAEGIYWARIPLPWSLDHINVYLLDEGESWTVIDTGAQGKRGREAWETLEQGLLAGKPIKHVVATHMHPDHLGLAGWLVERHDAEFTITQTEFLMAQHLWMSASEEFPESELDFLFKAGVNPDLEEMIRGTGFGNFKKGVHKLPYQYNRIEDGSELMLGGRRWRVLIGRGHSPEHACLLCMDEGLMISGDQILPQITSNVSVYAREPLANPLGHWIASLERMKQIEVDPLVLPSHGPVFKGLHNRLETLVSGHVSKLKSLHEWCKETRSPVDTFPALFKRKITGFDFFMALGEAIAHLHLLEALGLLKREFDGQVYRFTSVGDVANIDIVEATLKLPGMALRKIEEALI